MKESQDNVLHFLPLRTAGRGCVRHLQSRPAHPSAWASGTDPFRTQTRGKPRRDDREPRQGKQTVQDDQGDDEENL